MTDSISHTLDWERYWEMKGALCEIMDLINEVLPTELSEDDQSKFPASNAVERVKELIDLLQKSDPRERSVSMQWRRYVQLTNCQEQINKIKDIIEGETT